MHTTQRRSSKVLRGADGMEGADHIPCEAELLRRSDLLDDDLTPLSGSDSVIMSISRPLLVLH